MKIKKMVILSLLIAIQIVLSEFFAIKLPFIKLSLTIIPIITMAFFFGPYITALGLVTSDILGLFIFPVTSPHYGFVISNALTGLVYGFFLYNKRLSTTKKLYINLLISSLIVNFGINTILNTLWLTDIYGKSFVALLPLRFVKNLVSFIFNIVIVGMILPYIKNLTYKATLN